MFGNTQGQINAQQLHFFWGVDFIEYIIKYIMKHYARQKTMTFFVNWVFCMQSSKK